MGKISPPPPPSPLQQPQTFPPPPPQQPPPNTIPQTFNLDTKITPNILLIIIILAIIFFISGLLHLLIRLLLRPIQRNPIDLNHVTSLQGQLQQLFHLHDSGVDQSFIDNTFPIFFYEEIIGNLKEDPFDCAVCLCEFESHDKLRLLPKCSHAFHMGCIDTWLLSHSTCPLCRSSLLQDYSGGNNNHGCSLVCVLESNSVESGRISVSGSNPNPHLGFQGETQIDQFSSVQVDFRNESKNEEKIVNVKLGKFINEGSSEINNDNNNNISSGRVGSSLGNDDLGSRRCYSMGSFAYVLDETSSLQVPIRNTPMKKQSSSKKANLPLKPGQRLAMSEYGNDSQREFKGIGNERSKPGQRLAMSEYGNDSQREFKGIGNERSKRTDSFSISRIWSKKGKGNENECSKRATTATNSEFDEIDVSELGNDEETQSCYSVDSLAFPNTTPSNNNRRTLLWLMGRQNKIVHNHSSSLSSNV